MNFIIISGKQQPPGVMTQGKNQYKNINTSGLKNASWQYNYTILSSTLCKSTGQKVLFVAFIARSHLRLQVRILTKT